ncbi:protein DCL homolog, chloroplastic-like [Hibiscus syriacus]|uniref:protein DCL homolog, chloroplastic-like n=1 Tax=Hibiscus syriacus TaxID=106335 RepID=UPI0019250181|nr:protein DCL homolog, chloroplastic-like [Hibiscus syriacus]XP_039033008.1 protein DCL homolog, chloroplastic-like [Hibiscus syriacus]
MVTPILLRRIPLLQLQLQRYNRFSAEIVSSSLRLWRVASESTDHQEEVSSMEKSSSVLTERDLPKYHRWDDPDYKKLKDKEDEILRDIESIISLVKDIVHSNRYMDGERLNVSDEETVLEKLLRHHPHSGDKIGCGLDSIMVDRHPQFRNSRCLFVVRTDGGWIDFSYQKCLRAYIREKYPSHAERFIREHFKRGSG